MSSFAGRDLKLTLLEASDQLGVSSGTLRNWVRSGLLRARKTGLQTFFDRNEINLFQKKIKSGQILKLRKRANKNISEKTHGHAELLLNKENEGLLVQLLNRNSKSPQHILLAIYLVQLIKQGLCRLEKSGLKFKNEQLKKEISEWGLNLNSTDLKSKLYEIQESSLDFSDHLLSYAYQYMSRIGEKQKAGAYYTPTGIIQKLMNSVMKQPGTLLDPCCGSGHFLVEGLQHLRAMGVDQPWSYIYGSDLDLNAVRVARAHLTLASAGQADSLGQIRHQDALLESAWSLKFKYVLTNPPWGFV